MIARRSLRVLLLLPAFGLAAGDLPQPIPLSKYEPLIQRSPFAPATAAATPAPPGFAEEMFVTGMARIGSNFYVSIYDRRANGETFSLGTGEEKNGLTLASVQWAEKVGESKVTVRKGNDFAVLEFDQTALAPPPAPAPQPAGQNRRPGQNGPRTTPPGAPRPGTVRNNGTIPPPRTTQPSRTIQPRANTPRIIPHPGQAQPAGTPPIRRRIRTINSPK